MQSARQQRVPQQSAIPQGFPESPYPATPPQSMSGPPQDGMNSPQGGVRTYSLSKIRQLVDLNGDSTNFDITFKVSSRNAEPFDIVVVDQTTLDNMPDIEYRTASNGHMSGNLVQDKNVYQNYFLVLKSEQPCDCDVEITKKELPHNPNAGMEPVDEKQRFEPRVASPSSSKEGGINWKLWLIIGTIVIGGVILFWVYRSDKKKKEGTGDVAEPAASPAPHAALPSPSPVSDDASVFGMSPGSSGGQSPSGGDDNILGRLKRLHMN
jgi:hypothetical protein